MEQRVAADAAPTLLWFRRDLRLADHPALHGARDGGGPVVPVFALDRRLWDRAGAPRQAFLATALADLTERTDGALRIVHGDPRRVIPAVAAHLGAASVHVSAETTPFGRARDEAVATALGEDTTWIATGSPYAVSPGRVTKDDGSPYRVFTPFAKAWRAHGWRDPAAAVRSVPWLAYDGPHRAELPTASTDAAIPTGTEAAAVRTWHHFRDGPLDDYASARNDPGRDATSRLSAYLHLGLLHPRTLLADLADRHGEGVEVWRSELCWREFYADVLWHHPTSAWDNYDRRFDRFHWDDDRDRFGAWQRGETGFPIVDAGMRQLVAEGWMHNRVRMITASFLVKDLHLPWQWGARHFLDHLVDGDVASNNHGWQWTAGSGTDASPYVRVFNPMLQGEKYDASGDYVRRWVPALRALPGKAAHTPWDHGGAPGYPERIVDHAAERTDALARYEAIRG
jgi:deoxyribodipyrimidine photo-lyase